MKALFQTDLDLAGLPIVVKYRLYLDDSKYFPPVTDIEIESAVVMGTTIALDLECKINGGELYQHIEKMIVEFEEEKNQKEATW